MPGTGIRGPRPTPASPRLAGAVMNLLRRIASLPGARVVLLDSRVRRALASVPRLRFLTTGWVTTRPLPVPTGEVLDRGQIRA